MAERKTITKKLRFEVFKRDGFTCQYCGRTAPDVILEVDHINPIKNNGDNTLLNLITSCFDCNRGKGKRQLSDKDELKKQQEQLKQINEKRNQMKMMLEWKEELANFEYEQVDEINKLLQVTGSSFSESGRENCLKLIKKCGFDEVYESTKISLNQYYKIGDKESVNKTFNTLFRICETRKKQKENPFIKDVNILMKIFDNKFPLTNYEFSNVKLQIMWLLESGFRSEFYEEIISKIKSAIYSSSSKSWAKTNVSEIYDDYKEIF